MGRRIADNRFLLLVLYAAAACFFLGFVLLCAAAHWDWLPGHLTPLYALWQPHALTLRHLVPPALFLVFLMVLNMFGAITIVPAFYSIMRPKVATALLTDEQREAMRLQKERERKLGLRDDDE